MTRDLAGVIRNDLLLIRDMQRTAIARQEEVERLMADIGHRLNGVLQSLEQILESERQRSEVRATAPGGTRSVASDLLWVNPTGKGVRNDPAGSGAFGLARERDGRRYAHRGLDLEAVAGENVLAPIDGIVERVGLVYANDVQWRLMVLAGDEYGQRIEVKLMYVVPRMEVIGHRVKAGDPIGAAQDITKKYPGRGMKPHVHVEVRKGGDLVDPTGLFFA